MLFTLILAGFQNQISVQPEIDRIVKHIPENTESVVVIRPGEFGKKQTTEIGSGLPRSWIGSPGRSLTDNIPAARYIVSGARNFQMPKGIGAGKFEGFTISSYTPENISKVKNWLVTKVKKTTTLLGRTVYTISETTNGEIQSAFYWIEGDKFIFINSKPYYQEYLSAPSPEKPRFNPQSLKLWKYVQQDSPFIGFRKVSAKARAMGYGFNFGDANWQEFVVNVKADKTAIAYHLSTDNTVLEKISPAWKSQEIDSTLTEISQNLIEIKLAPEQWSKTSPNFYFIIALGYTILI